MLVLLGDIQVAMQVVYMMEEMLAMVIRDAILAARGILLQETNGQLAWFL